MANKKKPTMNEVKSVVSNIIVELKSMYEHISKIDKVLFSYIEMNGDHDKFMQYMKDETKKLNKEGEQSESKSQESGDSSGKNRNTKTRKKASKAKS